MWFKLNIYSNKFNIRINFYIKFLNLYDNVRLTNLTNNSFKQLYPKCC